MIFAVKKLMNRRQQFICYSINVMLQNSMIYLFKHHNVSESEISKASLTRQKQKRCKRDREKKHYRSNIFVCQDKSIGKEETNKLCPPRNMFIFPKRLKSTFQNILSFKYCISVNTSKQPCCSNKKQWLTFSV